MSLKIQHTRQVVDVQTGEILPIVSLIPEEKDKNYIKVFKLFSQKVLQDLKSDLNGATDLLIWIIDKVADLPVNSEPIVNIIITQVAQELNVSVPTVKRHLKKLKEYGYIQQIAPRQCAYRVNPDYLYRGNVAKYYKSNVIDS